MLEHIEEAGLGSSATLLRMYDERTTAAQDNCLRNYQRKRTRTFKTLFGMVPAPLIIAGHPFAAVVVAAQINTACRPPALRVNRVRPRGSWPTLVKRCGEPIASEGLNSTSGLRNPSLVAGTHLT